MLARLRGRLDGGQHESDTPYQVQDLIPENSTTIILGPYPLPRFGRRYPYWGGVLSGNTTTPTHASISVPQRRTALWSCRVMLGVACFLVFRPAGAWSLLRMRP